MMGIVKIALVVTLVLISGCGYRPSAHFTKAVVGDTLSVQVLISTKDPENTVLIRDAVETAVLTRFKASLVEQGKAQTHLNVILKGVDFTPLQYDNNGYVVAYRTKADLQIYRVSGKETRPYSVRGIYDFIVEPNAIISDQARFEAIRFSADKALESFVARIAAEGANQ